LDIGSDEELISGGAVNRRAIADRGKKRGGEIRQTTYVSNSEYFRLCIDKPALRNLKTQFDEPGFCVGELTKKAGERQKAG
jgi:hypothetical protein